MVVSSYPAMQAPESRLWRKARIHKKGPAGGKDIGNARPGRRSHHPYHNFEERAGASPEGRIARILKVVDSATRSPGTSMQTSLDDYP